MKFSNPALLSLSAIDPERLEVTINEELRSLDYNMLSPGTSMKTIIPQQMDASQLKQLESFKENVEKPVVYFSVLQLVINLAIGAGLKHMWKMINVL